MTNVCTAHATVETSSLLHDPRARSLTTKSELQRHRGCFRAIYAEVDGSRAKSTGRARDSIPQGPLPQLAQGLNGPQSLQPEERAWTQFQH
jgi:hypothetical protein